MFELIAYSALNLFFYFLISPVINYIFPMMNVPGLISSRTFDYRSTLFISFVLPMVIGFLSGIIPKWSLFQKFLGGVFLFPEPTPWDFLFGQGTKSLFILFHLKSGSAIGGLYSSKSRASAFPLEKEVYIEEVWSIDEHGRFIQCIEDTAGALILMGECSHIELFSAGPEPERKKLWTFSISKTTAKVVKKNYQSMVAQPDVLNAKESLFPPKEGQEREQ